MAQCSVGKETGAGPQAVLLAYYLLRAEPVEHEVAQLSSEHLQ